MIPSAENRKCSLSISLLFAALMAATRFHPMISVGLPDASWAIFFLSGLYLRSIFLPVFLAEATLIDTVVTVNGGDAWCITPAYLFLIPTYASLWGGGRWYARRHRSSWGTFLPLSAVLSVSAGAAFFISNLGFYLFSGYFGEMRFGQYAAAVAKYYPPYLTHTLFYVALVVCLYLLIGAIGRSKQTIVPTGEAPR